MDRRFDIIQQRLSQLSTEEIERLHEGIMMGKVCYDEVNYDEINNRFCPLAIALGLDKIDSPTEEKIQEALAQRFQPVNALKGIPGTFYHGDSADRESDLLGLINILRK